MISEIEVKEKDFSCSLSYNVEKLEALAKLLRNFDIEGDTDFRNFDIEGDTDFRTGGIGYLLEDITRELKIITVRLYPDVTGLRLDERDQAWVAGCEGKKKGGKS